MEYQTIRQLYESYRDELKKSLTFLETHPAKLKDAEFIVRFDSYVDRLESLIDLYANILALNRK